MGYNYTDADLIRLHAHISRHGTPDGFTPTRRKHTNNEESRNQQAIVKWWKLAHNGFGLPEIALIAHPNQGARSAANGARMKAEGARKGTLDMQLTAPSGGFHGLWIENKTPTGRVSPEQRAQMKHLIEQGYAVSICRSFDEAVKAITDYLNR